MTVYLVMWAGGGAPTAIDAYASYKEAKESYDATLRASEPRDYVNLVEVTEVKVVNLEGATYKETTLVY